MKLYAQHGFADGNKLQEGVDNEYIDGIVFSPRDIAPASMESKFSEFSKYSDLELYFDPQLFPCVMRNTPNLNTGRLEQYDEYFSFQTKNKLEIESNIRDLVKRTLIYENNFDISAFISPNILISRSFDSRDSVISKNFIRLSKTVSNEINPEKDVFASLAISYKALFNITELQEFLNDITIMANPPDGYYLLIDFDDQGSRANVLIEDAIAAWMLINYTLHVNEYKVINGYSDILSPLLGAVGGYAGCTGWWSNLRCFSITKKYTTTSSGGRQPIVRYLSNNLLNRITHIQLDAIRKKIPEVLNDLETDDYYTDDDAEIERTDEILQAWESIQDISSYYSSGNIATNLDLLLELIDSARSIYTQANQIISLTGKSNDDHLDALEQGIIKFRKLAEV